MTITYREADVLRLMPGTPSSSLQSIIHRTGLVPEWRTGSGRPRDYTAHDVACLRLIRLISDEYGFTSVQGGESKWPAWLPDAAELVRQSPLKQLGGKCLFVTKHAVSVRSPSWAFLAHYGRDVLTVIPCDQLIEGLVP